MPGYMRLHSTDMRVFSNKFLIVGVLFVVLNVIIIFNSFQVNQQVSKRLNLLQKWMSVSENMQNFFMLRNVSAKELSANTVALHQLMSTDDSFFLLEPLILKEATDPMDWNVIRRNFDLDASYAFDAHKLCLGVFHTNLDRKLVALKTKTNFVEILRVTGRAPYTSGTEQLTHLFVKIDTMHVHIVVVYGVRNFLWLGRIEPGDQLKLLNFNIHYGKNYEEIYDPIEVRRHGNLGLHLPAEPGRLLAQRPTARYLNCTAPEKLNWAREFNQTYNADKVTKTEHAIVSMKQLMWQLRMEFWAVCGTLLGWYRQCHVTSYTSDTDFATWPRYIDGWSTVELMRRLAPMYKLHFLNRFGEPTKSLEVSFLTKPSKEKADLFFMYHNATHFLMPYHIPWRSKYVYAIYPIYRLCSADLIGYKVLMPCDPEKLVLAEYGPKWRLPVSNWDYTSSLFNNGPEMNFTFNVPQFKQYT